MQLFRINAGVGQVNQFPDFDLWKQTGNAPGVCVRFIATDSAVERNLCNGPKPDGLNYPDAFETFYHWLFNAGFEKTRSIAFNGRVYGSLTVTPSAEMEIAQAWENIRGLLGLSAITVLAVCLLVFLSINRALRPAGIIVDGLERMETAHAYRLPSFELIEWQRTAMAINQLAASQQQLLAERQKLTVKLINLQEEERRFLARELHDEFGQCLAAINALASSIAQTAKQQCPALVNDADHISRITQHMLDNVRDLLKRLRPAELDELGLAISLNSLVSGWNARSGGKSHYQLNILGDCVLLPEPLTITLFRITQECLTNIAKHSTAQNAKITLAITENAVTLTVEDDGSATELPFTETSGIGLLGIRERITALGGQLTLAIVQPHGLKVEAWLPIISITKPRT
jgi:signal transduction histidine kinase